MKKIFCYWGMAAILGTSITIAGTINKVEVFPPFLNVGCSNLNSDAAGKLGLALNKLTSKETDTKVLITVEEQLKVCRLNNSNGAKTLSFINVNPFNGYNVQYFDFKTNAINTRTEIIDVNEKMNRFEMGVYLSERGILNRSNLALSVADTVIGTVEISKLDLLNQNDIDILNNGKEVKKTVILTNTLNVTTLVDGQKINFGDQDFSGRNITFTFIKERQNYKIRAISLL